MADFAMLPYNIFYAPRLLPDGITIEGDYPAVAAWQNRVTSRPSVKKAIQDREAYMREFAQTDPIFPGERACMEPVFPSTSQAVCG